MRKTGKQKDGRQARRAKIRALNDAFWKSFRGGRVMMTAGVAALVAPVRNAVIDKIRAFDAFDDNNDPWGEHDFISIEHDGQTFFAKIDYYDLEDGARVRFVIKNVHGVVSDLQKVDVAGDRARRPTRRKLDPVFCFEVADLVFGNPPDDNGQGPEQLKMEFALWMRAAVGELIERECGVGTLRTRCGQLSETLGFAPQKPSRAPYERRPRPSRNGSSDGFQRSLQRYG